MSPEETKTTLEFEVKSLDSRKIIDIIPEIEQQSEDLQRSIAAKYPGTTVKIRRREGIPAHLIVQQLLLHVDWHAVAAGAEKAAAVFATTEFLKLITSKFRNVFAKPADTEQKSPQPGATPPPTESASPKKVAVKKKPPKKGRKAGSSKQKGRSPSKRRK
jgi:hypothetical protein